MRSEGAIVVQSLDHSMARVDVGAGWMDVGVGVDVGLHNGAHLIYSSPVAEGR